jgi:hypothetical protein
MASAMTVCVSAYLPDCLPVHPPIPHPTVQAENAVLLAKHLNQNAGEGWDFVAYFMPRTTVMCRQQLQVRPSVPVYSRAYVPTLY